MNATVVQRKARDVFQKFDHLCAHVLTTEDKEKKRREASFQRKKAYIGSVALSKKVYNMWTEIIENVESSARKFEEDFAANMEQNT